MRLLKPVLTVVLALAAALAAASAQAENYAYDALGRLVVVSTDDAKRATFTYDAPGNRTQSAGGAGALRAPLAVDDARSYTYGSGLLTFDPRINDSDPAGLPLTIIGVGPAQFGSASFTGASVTYSAPTTSVAATDVFAYTIQNSAGLTASAVAKITLGNAPPVAVPDAVSTLQNQPVTFDPRINDSDPGGNTISITGVTAPSHGTATSNAVSVTYTPASGYTGPDSFGYSIASVGGTASSTISMTVTPSGAPLAAALSASSWNWSRISTGPINRSPPLVVTASGGVPPYSYSWQYVSGDTQISVIPQGDGSSAVWNRTISEYGTWIAIWRVTVTDTASGSVTSSNITVRFIWDSGA